MGRCSTAKISQGLGASRGLHARQDRYIARRPAHSSTYIIVPGLDSEHHSRRRDLLSSLFPLLAPLLLDHSKASASQTFNSAPRSPARSFHRKQIKSNGSSDQIRTGKYAPTCLFRNFQNLFSLILQEESFFY